MTDGKRQPNEERQRQRNSHEPINLREYAGDAEDTQLTCAQVKEYLEDLDRRQRVQQERRIDHAGDDQ